MMVTQEHANTQTLKILDRMRVHLTLIVQIARLRNDPDLNEWIQSSDNADKLQSNIEIGPDLTEEQKGTLSMHERHLSQVASKMRYVRAKEEARKQFVRLAESWKRLRRVSIQLFISIMRRF